ncbi:hypothetical protein J7I81_17700 [Bacillus sp. ISL-32]|nr:hypothetical protein [Bacillus sp. ISL-32]
MKGFITFLNTGHDKVAIRIEDIESITEIISSHDYSEYVEIKHKRGFHKSKESFDEIMKRIEEKSKW